MLKYFCEIVKDLGTDFDLPSLFNDNFVRGKIHRYERYNDFTVNKVISREIVRDGTDGVFNLVFEVTDGVNSHSRKNGYFLFMDYYKNFDVKCSKPES